MIPNKTILESDPPVILASGLALKEGNSKKPIYTMHKWWARRLGAVFRLLFLGATHSSGRSAWLQNGAFFDKHDLSRIRVFDPFVGGGTSLVEASKCGASVIGNDIDPVAAFVTEKELQPIDEKRLQAAFATVEAAAKEACLKWYRTKLPDGRPGAITYAFWVEEITSPETGEKALAHPHYQLYRDRDKKRQTVFCSHCHKIHVLPLHRTNFTCTECRLDTEIRHGTVADGRINAPGFKPGQQLIKLYLEQNPPSYRLFALQVLVDGSDETVFKRADEADQRLFLKAKAEWDAKSQTDPIAPTESIPTRGVSLGRMSRLRTLLLSGPAPPDGAALWFGDLPMEAPLECCYGPPSRPSAMGLWFPMLAADAKLEIILGPAPGGPCMGIWRGTVRDWPGSVFLVCPRAGTPASGFAAPAPALASGVNAVWAKGKY